MTADPDRRALLRALALWPLSLAAAPAWAQAAADGAGLVAAERLPAHAGDHRGALLSRPATWCGATSPRGGRARRCGSRCRWWTPTAGRSRARGSTSGTAMPPATTRASRGRAATGARHPRRDLPARHPVRPTRAASPRFATIWPGWYRGRTPHVHYKVFLDDATRADQPALLPRRRQRGGLPRRAAYRARRGGAGHRPTPATASPAAPARAPSPGSPRTRALAGGAGRRRRGRLRPVAGLQLSQLGVERDVDRAVQQLRDRADLLGLLRRGLEGCLVGAGDLRLDRQVHVGDGEAAAVASRR